MDTKNIGANVIAMSNGHEYTDKEVANICKIKTNM